MLFHTSRSHFLVFMFLACATIKIPRKVSWGWQLDFQCEEDISEGCTKSQENERRDTIIASSIPASISAMGNVAWCCDVLLWIPLYNQKTLSELDSNAIKFLKELLSSDLSGNLAYIQSNSVVISKTTASLVAVGAEMNDTLGLINNAESMWQ